MEFHARAPDPLIKSSNMAKSWNNWKDEFLTFMTVTNYITKPDFLRVNLLKNRIGKVGLDAIQTLTLDGHKNLDKMDDLLKKLDEYFNPPQNEMVERYNFFSRRINDNEPIENYIRNLKEKAASCNFGPLTDSLIRDMVIFHIKDQTLRNKLLNMKEISLEKIIFEYNVFRMLLNQTNSEKKPIKTVHDALGSGPSSNSIAANMNRKCWRCQTTHPQRQCPAYKHKCTTCSKVGHFDKNCKPISNTKQLNIQKSLNNLNKIPKTSKDVMYNKL